MLTEILKPGTEFQLTDMEKGDCLQGKIVDTINNAIWSRINSIMNGAHIPTEGVPFGFETSDGNITYIKDINSIEEIEPGLIILHTRNATFRLNIIR